MTHLSISNSSDHKSLAFMEYSSRAGGQKVCNCSEDLQNGMKRNDMMGKCHI